MQQITAIESPTPRDQAEFFSLILGEVDALAVDLRFRHQLRWASAGRTHRTKAMRLAMIANPSATECPVERLRIKDVQHLAAGDARRNE
jgi:hypothetical protein